jgi:hypothetical protein
MTLVKLHIIFVLGGHRLPQALPGVDGSSARRHRRQRDRWYPSGIPARTLSKIKPTAGAVELSELEDQRMTTGLQGHGHGGNYARTMAAGANMRRLQRQLRQADGAYQQLLDRETHRYHSGGGRIGIISALFGSNSRSFLEASLRGIQRQLNALQPDVEEQARGLGTMATGLRGLHSAEIARLTARRAQVEEELRACPAEGGGCVVSRKSRQRKSRQRKSRRRTSRKNRRL